MNHNLSHISLPREYFFTKRFQFYIIGKWLKFNIYWRRYVRTNYRLCEVRSKREGSSIAYYGFQSLLTVHRHAEGNCTFPKHILRKKILGNTFQLRFNPHKSLAENWIPWSGFLSLLILPSRLNFFTFSSIFLGRYFWCGKLFIKNSLTVNSFLFERDGKNTSYNEVSGDIELESLFQS